jgi:hypothetical protein
MGRELLEKNRGQLGGGKIGCLFTLAFVVVVIALGIRVFPFYYSNNKLFDATAEIAAGAAKLNKDTVQKQVAAKAKEYGIDEALAPGAIQVSHVKVKEGGTCFVRLRYAREVNFYGIFSVKLLTDKEIAKQFVVL